MPRAISHNGKVIKICSSCKVEKSAPDFLARKRYRDGLNPQCKNCVKFKNKSYKSKNKNRFTVSNKNAAWRVAGIKNPDGSYFKYKDYLNLLVLADNKCMLCGLINGNGDNLCVDHDHKTGIVRFLLCHYCNRGLGFLKDDPYLLKKASGMLFNFLEQNKKAEPEGAPVLL